jgi:hypothetical protein
MAKGKHRVDPPEHNDHFKNFDKAMKDALDNWSGDRETNVTVTLEATVTPNPGGVREYRVVLSP